MKFAIPTYKRDSIIKGLTLGYLERCGIKESEVYLFVSNLQEYEAYRKKFQDATIVNCNAENVRDKFNFIHSFYPKGECVVVLEDDLSSIKKLVGYNKLEEELGIRKICEDAFIEMQKNKIFLCGINSNSKFVVANMYMFIQTNPPVIGTQHSKTDYERTILYYERFGNLMRIDYLCPITKNYSISGGMQEVKDKREQIEQESVDYLTKNYSHLCKPNTTKKSMYAEMSLVLQPKNPEKTSDFAKMLLKSLT
jgi:hypothetical protein